MSERGLRRELQKPPIKIRGRRHRPVDGRLRRLQRIHEGRHSQRRFAKAHRLSQELKRHEREIGQRLKDFPVREVSHAQRTLCVRIRQRRAVCSGSTR